ncbi:MAG: hypothetical protein ACRD0P_25435 [Stackebrandtia sp.]
MRTTVSVAEILEAGACTPACLTASSDRRGCRCACRGDLHGVLTGTPVELAAAAAARMDPLPDGPPSLVTVERRDGAA